MFATRVKIGRNDPCWCGSGRKFKRCHLEREQQPRIRRQELIEESRRVRRQPNCFAPNAGVDCESIIAAHSVQKRGAGLAAIARKGHVYGFKTDFGEMDRSGGRMTPKLIGITEASTFAGFCRRHDSELFAPIERERLKPSPRQLTLLAYRAMCRELNAKRGALAFNPTLKKADQGKPAYEQLLWQWRMSSHATGHELALRDFEPLRMHLERAIVTDDHSHVRSLVFKLDRPPDVMASAAMTPEFTFTGEILQNLNDASRLMDVLTFSLVGTADGAGIAAFSWLRDATTSGRFVESADAIESGLLPHRLVQYVFEYFENIYWSPSWWESISEEDRRKLIDRMNSGLHMPHARLCLRDDGTRAASWRIVEHAFRS